MLVVLREGFRIKEISFPVLLQDKLDSLLSILLLEQLPFSCFEWFACCAFLFTLGKQMFSQAVGHLELHPYPLVLVNLQNLKLRF